MGNNWGSSRQSHTSSTASNEVKSDRIQNFNFVRPFSTSTTLAATNKQTLTTYNRYDPLRSKYDYHDFCKPRNPIGIATINDSKAVKFNPTPEERVSVNVPSSWNIWRDSYLKSKIEPDNYESLTTRISRNADDIQKIKEISAHRFRLQRIKETEKLFSEKESPKPASSLNSCRNIFDRLQSLKRLDDKYFPLKTKLPELTPQILNRIQEASRPQPLGELLVELDGIQILRKDIQTLLGLNWLNDEIVNAYMTLLVMRSRNNRYKKVYSFNTFFYPKLRETGYNSIKRWTRKVDIFSYNFLLVPVHLGNHWCLAFVDLNDKSISYYDSLGGSPSGCCDTLLDYLRYESSDKKKQELDDENWSFHNCYTNGIPQQKNCSDCGVFACTYAEFLTRQAKLDFSQNDMPYFRKKMIYEIITKEILE